MEGIIFALVPMFAWGLIGFTSNKIGGTANQQTLGLTIGALLFALVSWVIVRPEMTWTLWIVGIIGGLLWSAGQNGQFHAMKYMGVSVAQPLSSGSQLVVGSLVGVLVFNEWTKPIQFILGLAALIILLVGFYFSSKQDNQGQSDILESRDFPRGFRALTYSTIGYVSYAVLFNNIMKFDALSVLLPMAVGMFLGAVLFMKGNINFEPVVLKNSLVGLLWGTGNIFMLLAAAKAGLAIAFSFSQLGAVISIVAGILFLGEKKTKKELQWITIGTILFVVGAILLGIVKSY
ncbi:GRP family sugar transporter [Streptococcus thoraltensis]|uniref:GRP family sugar transporter n=1 Tax=Streptococcus thoraltensis TaxID=55085 RepID=UPI00035F0771|nr:GRP family sugar transporter [Streptococcus thoraltensis]MDY4760750.1 GRP family sugar transporter [Streptococcus thoraltensis]